MEVFRRWWKMGLHGLIWVRSPKIKSIFPIPTYFLFLNSLYSTYIPFLHKSRSDVSCSLRNAIGRNFLLGKRHRSESAKQNDRRALRYWQAHEKVMHEHHEALPYPNATSRFRKRARTEVPCYGKESSLRNAANRCVGHAHHEALPCPNAASRFRKRATTEVPCYGKESSSESSLQSRTTDAHSGIGRHTKR